MGISYKSGGVKTPGVIGLGEGFNRVPPIFKGGVINIRRVVNEPRGWQPTKVGGIVSTHTIQEDAVCRGR